MLHQLRLDEQLVFDDADDAASYYNTMACRLVQIRDFLDYQQRLPEPFADITNIPRRC